MVLDQTIEQRLFRSVGESNAVFLWGYGQRSGNRQRSEPDFGYPEEQLSGLHRTPQASRAFRDCFCINGDLDDVAGEDSASSSDALQLKLFVCGSQHQERRRFANVQSASGAVPKLIRDSECSSRDEE